MSTRPETFLNRWCVALAVVFFFVPVARGGLNGETCVSANNTAYFVLKTNDASTRVTSVAFGENAANSCVEQSADTVQTAVAVSGPTLPSIRRTAILSSFTTNANVVGNCLPPKFNPTAAGGFGILTLPNGSRVSANSAHPDCAGCLGLSTLASTNGGVPRGVSRNVSRFASVGITSCAVTGSALVFPNSYSATPIFSDGRATMLDATDSGEVANQQVTLDDSKSSAIGNVAPGNTVAPTQVGSDGFLLRGTCPGANCQMIVFTASSGGARSFGIGAAGFVVDSSGLQTATNGFATNREFRIVIGPVPAPALPFSGLAAALLLLAAIAHGQIRRTVALG